MSIAPTAPVAPAAPSQAPAKSDDGWDFSFKNLLDIVNPLQHIPIVSAIYRKLTGDIPATPEKIAGDTLYGGVIGFVSSLADSAFEAVTGKDFGDTVLAFFTGGDKPALVAQASTPPSNAAPLPAMPGAGSDTALRAAVAYRKSIGMTESLANAW